MHKVSDHINQSINQFILYQQLPASSLHNELKLPVGHHGDVADSHHLAVE